MGRGLEARCVEVKTMYLYSFRCRCRWDDVARLKEGGDKVCRM